MSYLHDTLQNAIDRAIPHGEIFDKDGQRYDHLPIYDGDLLKEMHQVKLPS